MPSVGNEEAERIPQKSTVAELRHDRIALKQPAERIAAMDELLVRGPRQHVQAFVTDLRDIAPNAVNVVLAERKTSVLDRRPFGQYDLVEAAITIATAILAPIVTAEIQRIIKLWRKRDLSHGIEIEEKEKNDHEKLDDAE
jgi:hypothetical protein